MAACEFHDAYREYLKGEVAGLSKDGFRSNELWSKVWDAAFKTAIARHCENIFPEEAEAIFADIFTLYPQFEERIKAELAEEHLG